jgi:hypothetical protein
MSKYFTSLLIPSSLIIGLLIYLGWRDTSHPFYRRAASFGWASEIDGFRASVASFDMPEWFIYSLPDGLWMFAFVLFMMSLWDFKFYGLGRFWIIAAIIVGITFEIAQGFTFGMGSFDWIDLVWIIFGAVLPVLLFTKRNKSYEEVF